MYSRLLFCCAPFFPKQRGNTTVPIVMVKDGCLIEVLAAGSGCTLNSCQDLLNAFRLRRLAESGGLARVLFETALLVICDRHKEDLVVCRLLVPGAGDRGGFMSMCRFCGRCSALEMVVVFGVLRFRGGCIES